MAPGVDYKAQARLRARGSVALFCDQTHGLLWMIVSLKFKA
jgi:hypothetical protein